MTSSRPARRFDWSNLGARAVSATVLAPLTVFAVWAGGWAFLVMISAAVALLAMEWTVMIAPEARARLAVTVTAAVLIGVFAAYLDRLPAAWLLLGVGAGAAALVGRGRSERPVDAAFGVIYIGAPAVALAWLRDAPQGRSWTILLFAVTWAADIGAFAVGSIFKGPKLWPRFSPNKTWSGFAGGLLSAVAASVAVSVLGRVQLSVAAATLMGLVGGLATMAGDLWESMLKRRFGVKDSGDLIPGHGGLLDRVDGLMFAILAVSAARLVHLAGWAT